MFCRNVQDFKAQAEESTFDIWAESFWLSLNGFTGCAHNKNLYKEGEHIETRHLLIWRNEAFFLVSEVICSVSEMNIKWKMLHQYYHNSPDILTSTEITHIMLWDDKFS